MRTKQQEINYITEAYTFRINQIVLSETIDEELKDWIVHKLAEDLATDIQIIEDSYV